MSIIKSYTKTTLAFWLDTEETSSEQLAVLAGFLIGGNFLSGLFVDGWGKGYPQIHPKIYIFPVIAVYIFSYYFLGKKLQFFYNKTALKFIRLVLLHLTLAMLSFAALISIPSIKGDNLIIIISSLFSTAAIYTNTLKIYKKQITHLQLIRISLILSFLGYISMRYFILPYDD